MMTTMDLHWKFRWLAALRSGNYKQGTGYLRDPTSNTFCCLSILCLIHPDVEWIDGLSGGHSQFTAHHTVKNGASHNQRLPNTFRESIGINESIISKLVRMNDGEYRASRAARIGMHTFKEIADYIEEKL